MTNAVSWSKITPLNWPISHQEERPSTASWSISKIFIYVGIWIPINLYFSSSGRDDWIEFIMSNLKRLNFYFSKLIELNYLHLFYFPFYYLNQFLLLNLIVFIFILSYIWLIQINCSSVRVLCITVESSRQHLRFGQISPNANMNKCLLSFLTQREQTYCACTLYFFAFFFHC